MKESAKYKQEDGTYKVDADMIIGDVIMAFPKAAAIMMGHGLHCVGCAANSFDTVEGGAKLHGMPEEEIKEMVSEINEAINHIIETME
ncbi:DUF1858 domain-containing protein, partial [Candidatus Woesearchaeota archaeon]|nr:DUF1858 domain-containing protein [Candidatus Woesearchaeota archaeon]